VGAQAGRAVGSATKTRSEDPFALSKLAEEKGVTAIVECGVAPGMSNLLVGHADHQLDKTDSVLIYVGGLPEKRTWPYEYRAVFSPADVIEESLSLHHHNGGCGGHRPPVGPEIKRPRLLAGYR